MAGLLADARQIVSTAREEGNRYKNFYGHAIPVAIMNRRFFFLSKITLKRKIYFYKTKEFQVLFNITH